MLFSFILIFEEYLIFKKKIICLSVYLFFWEEGLIIMTICVNASLVWNFQSLNENNNWIIHTQFIIFESLKESPHSGECNDHLFRLAFSGLASPWYPFDSLGSSSNKASPRALTSLLTPRDWLLSEQVESLCAPWPSLSLFDHLDGSSSSLFP